MTRDAFVNRSRRVLLSCASILLVACATGNPAPGKGDVRTLETRLRQDSSAANVRLRLAIAYRDSGDMNRAITLLQPVVREDPHNDAAALWLGLSYEDANRYTEARRQYESFLEDTRSGALHDAVESRLALVSRRELRAAVQQSITRERELTAAAPTPRTVGVFPFLFAGRDTTLRPLGRALADMLTTDLAQTDRLRVLERTQLQTLLDELKLSGTRYVDAATAARAGHMLSAEHLVQGRITGGQSDLAIEALIVATRAPRDSAVRPVNGAGGLGAVFDIEKQLALGVYQRLGIQLTGAERARIEQRATSNVQALLAFGFGLEAQDAGNYAEAARQFARAAQLDPGFRRARQMAAQATQLGQASTLGTAGVSQQALQQIDLSLTSWQRQRLGVEFLERNVPDPQVRDPVVEVLGTEGLGRGTLIDIIIRRPAGGS
jgi:tetratricopeptide (TPR) repeat protein